METALFRINGNNQGKWNCFVRATLSEGSLFVSFQRD